MSGVHAPERLSLPSVVHAEYEGPSALLHANHTLACGPSADEALRRADVGEGLFLVHSHRHELLDFTMHARALHLASRSAPSLVRNSSLLVFNNNGAAGQRYPNPSFIEWLHACALAPSQSVAQPLARPA